MDVEGMKGGNESTRVASSRKSALAIKKTKTKQTKTEMRVLDSERGMIVIVIGFRRFPNHSEQTPS